MTAVAKKRRTKIEIIREQNAKDHARVRVAKPNRQRSKNVALSVKFWTVEWYVDGKHMGHLDEACGTESYARSFASVSLRDSYYGGREPRIVEHEVMIQVPKEITSGE